MGYVKYYVTLAILSSILRRYGNRKLDSSSIYVSAKVVYNIMIAMVHLHVQMQLIFMSSFSLVIWFIVCFGPDYFFFAVSRYDDRVQTDLCFYRTYFIEQCFFYFIFNLLGNICMYRYKWPAYSSFLIFYSVGLFCLFGLS